MTIKKKRKKNSITTQGYFVKRLRDNGFFVSKIYDRYNSGDNRKWTVLINPKLESLFITCYDNGEWPYRGLYLLDDAGQKLPKNYFINTDSIEVIVKHLIDFNIGANGLNISGNGRRQEQKTPKTSKESKKATQEPSEKT